MAFSGSFVVAQNAKLVVNAGKATEMTLRGLQTLGIPIGASASTVTVSEMGRRVDLVLASGLTYESVSTDYNFVIGDPSQTYMMEASRNATQITDARFYIDSTHFGALDLISDTGGYLQVGSMTSPTASKNEVFSGSVEFMPAGSFILFPNHVVGTTLGFVAGVIGVSNAKITDSASGFVTEGFVAGQTVYIDHADGLDPLCCKIETVIAGEIELVEGVGDADSLTTSAGIATSAIHGGDPVEISGY